MQCQRSVHGVDPIRCDDIVGITASDTFRPRDRNAFVACVAWTLSAGGNAQPDPAVFFNVFFYNLRRRVGGIVVHDDYFVVNFGGLCKQRVELNSQSGFGVERRNDNAD